MATAVKLRDRTGQHLSRGAESPTAYRRWRVRKNMVSAVVFLVAAAGGWVQHVHDRARIDVLVVVRTVPAGDRISDADIRLGSVALSRGIAFIPARDRSGVVGRTASVALAAGSLLTRAQLTDVISDSSRVQLGIAVKPGQYPPSIKEGDKVIIIITAPPSPTSSRSATSTPPDEPIPAVVRQVDRGRGAFGEGDVVITVSVLRDDLDRLAPAAAEGRVALAAGSS
jgi:hypothetical protein